MAYTYGKDSIKKNCYKVFVTATSNTTDSFNGTVANNAMNAASGTDVESTWVHIGALSESPTLTTAEGDTVALADCTDLVISETAEISAEILEVTDDNWTEIRKLHNEKTDIIFSVSNTTAGNTAIGVTQVVLKANLEITGNDQNKITLSGDVEAGDVTDKIGFIQLTE